MQQPLRGARAASHRSVQLLGAVTMTVGAMWLTPTQQAARAYSTFFNTVAVSNDGSTTYTVPVEYPPADTSRAAPVPDNYLPNVVNQEDGLANSFVAYEAQAIAARSYLYYTTNDGANLILNGTRNQVYYSPTSTVATNNPGDTPNGNTAGPTASEELAVQASQGIILEYGSNPKITTSDTLVDGFFVAGATPTSADANFGKATNDTGGNTATEPDVTYNRGLVGNAVTGSPLGSSANPANRGALSQNGVNYITTTADNKTGTNLPFNVNDAMRYYYGADIHLTVASPTSVASEITSSIPIETFGTDNGYFANGVVSSSNVNVGSVAISHSSDSHVASVSGGITYGSQVLTISGASGAPFTYVDLSGLGPNSVQTVSGAASSDISLVGEAAGNLNMPAIGTVSYWIKVISGNGVSTDLVLNNDTTGVATAGVAQTLIDDGQFHQYVFSLANFPGITSGFQNDFSVNAIEFTGVGTVTYELNDLEYNETGVAVPEPTMLALLPAAGLLLRRRARR